MHQYIEDIILQKDRRGISAYKHLLPKDYCLRAADNLLKHKGTVFIVSGFYILAANAPETDGPQGAVLLGRALQKLGYKVYYISDAFSAHLFTPLVNKRDLLLFPMEDALQSEQIAQQWLEKYSPTTLISIERCGLTASDNYLNMRGKDISAYNARVDALFLNHTNTMGIGDGGNEIGMGNIAEQIAENKHPVTNPCIIPVDHLILAAVSNWGVYGLLAALSKLSGQQLLPSATVALNILEKLADAGAVDGITLASTPTADGFDAVEEAAVLIELKRLIG